MNSRITYVKSLELSGHPTLSPAVFRGLVNCLSTKDACVLMKEVYNSGKFELRDALLRKLCSEIRTQFTNEHAKLVAALMAQRSNATIHYRQSQGVCLTALAYSAPDRIKREITIFFVRSPYVAFRRRGYKLARQFWHKAYMSEIQRAWLAHQDFECTRLITEHSSILFLKANARHLSEQTQGTWLLSKLYIRLAANNRQQLTTLRALDGISYAYVITKLGLKLSTKEARILFDRYRLDERIGLLVWCFGQQRLWSVLQQIALRLKELATEHEAALYQRLGLPQTSHSAPLY